MFWVGQARIGMPYSQRIRRLHLHRPLERHGTRTPCRLSCHPPNHIPPIGGPPRTMRATLRLPKAKSTSASSSRWKQRQSTDPFVKARVTESNGTAYRSRASFKLLSINNRFPFLLDPLQDYERPKIIVDLGAAPGGWSQAAAAKLGTKGRVFALDILDFPPIPDVHSIQGDFLDQKVQEKLRRAVEELRPLDFGLAGRFSVNKDEREAVKPEALGVNEGIVDVVLSDMMGSMSGNRTRDTQISLDLVEAASTFASRVLKNGVHEAEWKHMGHRRWPGGHFVVKYFQHPDMNEFKKEYLQPRYRKIVNEKPPESRNESAEAYWVCLGYTGEPISKVGFPVPDQSTFIG